MLNIYLPTEARRRRARAKFQNELAAAAKLILVLCIFGYWIGSLAA